MFGQIEDSIVQQAWAQVPPRPPAQTREALRQEAKQLLQAQGAALVAHYYVDAELQTLAEETGGCVSDSLEMARFGRDHEAQTLVVAGVRFMGETAKILSPEKRILMPDLSAECSLDLGCPTEAFIDFKRQHPDRTVVVYANTSAEIKAEADWVVTSSIALPIVEHLKARGEKILWAPDQHLGSYIQEQTGADMIHWQGACVVHDEFKGSELQAMIQRYPDAKVLVHPESPKEVVALADAVGSTSQLLDAPEKLGGEYFIVATDSGIFHKMQERYPGKTFVAAPTAGSSATCKSCAFCPWMALNGLQNLVDVLKSGENEIFVDEDIRQGACRSLDRMLDFSREYKLAQQRGDFQPGIGPA